MYSRSRAGDLAERPARVAAEVEDAARGLPGRRSGGAGAVGLAHRGVVAAARPTSGPRPVARHARRAVGGVGPAASASAAGCRAGRAAARRRTRRRSAAGASERRSRSRSNVGARLAGSPISSHAALMRRHPRAPGLGVDPPRRRRGGICGRAADRRPDDLVLGLGVDLEGLVGVEDRRVGPRRRRSRRDARVRPRARARRSTRERVVGRPGSSRRKR